MAGTRISGIRWVVAGLTVYLLGAAPRAFAQCGNSCVLVNDPTDTTHMTCSFGGTGTCSLRDGLTLTQAFSGWSIQFAIGSGPQRISLLTDPPDIITVGTIDGSTQPGFAGTPLIEIHRDDAGTARWGLRIGSPPLVTEGGITVRALVINHFASTGDSAGIRIVNPGSNTVQGCWIGVDATGMVADGNTSGISIDDFGGDLIGGLTAADRNVVSGNFDAGISVNSLRGGYSIQDVIQGNYVGTNALGTAALPGGSAIVTDPPFSGFTPGIVIGGPVGSGAGNVVAGVIELILGVNNKVEGNHIGLDPTGLIYLAPSGGGLALSGETNDTIADNLIVGTTALGAAIYMDAGAGGVLTTGTTITGNSIGTDITGNTLPPGFARTGIGILVIGTQGNTIGGPGAAANVVGGFDTGMEVHGTDNVVLGNHVGIGADGVTPIPNKYSGITIYGSNITIGGINSGEGNVIAHNGSAAVPGSIGGVGVGGLGVGVPGISNTIRGNAIFDNFPLGIDLSDAIGTLPNGVSPNEPGSPHDGANRGQNFPIFTDISFPDPTHVRVQGTLNAKPTTVFTLDFYANDPLIHPSDFLQAKTWIGFAPVTTDSQGNVSFDLTYPVASDTNTWISATATDDGGNTSEVSQRSLFSINPNHGPAGPTPMAPLTANAFTLTGQLFQAGATVDFGGLFASNVNVANDASITGQTPTLTAGMLWDVRVTNPDTTTAVMKKAWVSDFLDVPSGSPFYPFVISLALDGVTGGCGGGNYCPFDDVRRDQMAVFLLKAKHGPFWVPPPATGTVFGDVPLGSFAADWIEELFNERITSGCGGGNYCPGNPVTRAQMAPFLLKAEHGSAYLPPACAGIFGDVACPSLFADWIEELYNEHITGGCSVMPLLYCPADDVTRGQMAIFVVKTFELP
jgi:hypothetical protein